TKKYGYDAGFLFAVGDGNHSLVTAKKHWESIREGLSEEERLNHPARYALAEIENLWSPAIKFEPIHRIIFGNTEGLLAELESAAGGVSKLGVLTAGGRTEIAVSDNSIEAISQIQRFIDKKLKDKAPFEVDYIHGDDYLKEIHKFKGGIALFMPKVKKSELFPYVLKQGVMPKKSFSMGDAEEKRYYLEAKKITK
ncbi:MAG TPA: DUF1015 family protein, partial [Eubacteriales bacterium]|nr:DUF1015 family protein [Eubacteriales bacterium]